MPNNRQNRVADALRDALNRIFQQRLQDPRLPKMLTITRVDVAKDGRDATAYFSQLPDSDAAIEKSFDAIDHSIGFIRTELAHELDMRYTPILHFRYDPSQKNYQQINKVILKLKSTGAMGSEEPESAPPAEEPKA